MFATLRQRNFALLWFAGLISLTGDWMLKIALPIYVYKLTGSALATSTMFIAAVVPDIALSSVAGVFVDRWNRRRIMVITNLLLALGLLPLLVVHSSSWLWLVYIVAFAESCISQFFSPAESAMLPLLVSEDHLISANSLNSLNKNIARLAGPPLGGIVAGLLGLAGVALMDAASFLLAGLMIALIVVRPIATKDSPALTRVVRSKPWLKVWREWLEGLQIMRRERQIANVFTLLAIAALGEGVFEVLIVVFVKKVLGGGALELGWLMGAQAVGGLIGAVLISHVSIGISPYRLTGICAILFGLIDLMIFNYPAFFPGIAPGLVLFFLVGIPGIGVFTGVTTLMQTSVQDEYRGRVFGAGSTIAALSMLLGILLAGISGSIFGVVSILNVQGLMYMLVGVFVLFFLIKSRSRVAPALPEQEEKVGVEK